MGQNGTTTYLRGLKAIRKQRGLKLKELGEAADVSESQMQMIESGKRLPSFEVMLKLSEFLDCSFDELIYGDTPTAESDDLAESLRILQTRPDLRALLNVTNGLTPAAVERITAMIEGMKEG